LIRHARLRLAPPVLALPVAMIQPSFRTLLVPAVGVALLLPSCGGAAVGPAIALPTITVLTDPEYGVASTAPAQPLPQNHFPIRHVGRRRG